MNLSDHVTLCWKDTFGTDREYEMAFGYDATDGEPTVAIMWEGCEHPISVPISVMIEAVVNGWNKSDGTDIPFPSFLPGDPALN
jgi:hypothetical protein